MAEINWHNRFTVVLIQSRSIQVDSIQTEVVSIHLQGRFDPHRKSVRFNQLTVLNKSQFHLFNRHGKDPSTAPVPKSIESRYSQPGWAGRTAEPFQIKKGVPN